MAISNTGLPINDDSGVVTEENISLRSEAASIDAFNNELSTVISNPFSEIPPHLKEMTQNLAARATSLQEALPALQEQHSILETVDALTMDHLTRRDGHEIDHLSMIGINAEHSDVKQSPSKPTKPSTPLDYLNIDTPSEKKALKEKALTNRTLDGSLLETHAKVVKASKFLIHLAGKSREVALAILHGTNPIEPRGPQLGSGSFATVYRSKVSETPCAEKHFNTRGVATLETEYSRLSTFQGHPNIIKLHLADEESLYLELANKGSLTASIEDTSLSRQEFTTIAAQTADALAHIHSIGFVHRDIKTDNILLTTTGARISDFGTVIPVAELNPKDTQGTVAYLPPEYIRGMSTKENCQKIDVWSFGMLLWQQMKKEDLKTPFTSKDNPTGSYESFRLLIVVGNFKGFKDGELEATLDTQDELDPTTGEVAYSSLINYYDPNRTLVTLMKRCLALNPDDRPTMEEVKAILAEEVESCHALAFAQEFQNLTLY